MDTNVKTIILKQEFEIQSTKKKRAGNIYEPEVTLKDKARDVLSHKPGSVIVDETLAKIKTQELQIGGWMLTQDQQLMKFNL